MSQIVINNNKNSIKKSIFYNFNSESNTDNSKNTDFYNYYISQGKYLNILLVKSLDKLFTYKLKLKKNIFINDKLIIFKLKKDIKDDNIFMIELIFKHLNNKKSYYQLENYTKNIDIFIKYQYNPIDKIYTFNNKIDFKISNNYKFELNFKNKDNFSIKTIFCLDIIIDIKYYLYNLNINNTFCGLKNIGNSCYLNCLFQIFSNLNCIYNFLVININKEYVSREVYYLVKLFYKLRNNKISFNPYKLFKKLGISEQLFYQQEDFQEVLLTMVRQLSILFTRLKVKNYISLLFDFEIKNYINCVNVNYSKTIPQTINNLFLEVKNLDNIYNSFENYLTKEYMSDDNKYLTEDFGYQDAEKGIEIITLPNVLTLYLRRVEYTQHNPQKIFDYFEFYEKINLNKYVNNEEENNNDNIFYLYSVVVHIGNSSNNGHYITFIKKDLDKWYEFDDKSVIEVTWNYIKSVSFGGLSVSKRINYSNNTIVNNNYLSNSNAYVLIYIKKKFKDEFINLNNIKLNYNYQIKFNDNINKMLNKKLEKYITVVVYSDFNNNSFGILKYKEYYNDSKLYNCNNLKLYLKPNISFKTLLNYFKNEINDKIVVYVEYDNNLIIISNTNELISQYCDINNKLSIFIQEKSYFNYKSIQNNNIILINIKIYKEGLRSLDYFYIDRDILEEDKSFFSNKYKEFECKNIYHQTKEQLLIYNNNNLEFYFNIIILDCNGNLKEYYDNTYCICDIIIVFNDNEELYKLNKDINLIDLKLNIEFIKEKLFEGKFILLKFLKKDQTIGFYDIKDDIKLYKLLENSNKIEVLILNITPNTILTNISQMLNMYNIDYYDVNGKVILKNEIFLLPIRYQSVKETDLFIKENYSNYLNIIYNSDFDHYLENHNIINLYTKTYGGINKIERIFIHNDCKFTKKEILNIQLKNKHEIFDNLTLYSSEDITLKQLFIDIKKYFNIRVKFLQLINDNIISKDNYTIEIYKNFNKINYLEINEEELNKKIKEFNAINFVYITFN